MISCSSAEEMLPSWGVLVSCYFIALRGNKWGFEEKERKWKWQGNNRSISIIFLHQVISRLLCHCLRFKETQGEIKQFTHSPNCCMRLCLNQRVFKAHYRLSVITLAQASISFLQQHERDREPTDVLRAETARWPPSSWPSPQGKAAERELPSPPDPSPPRHSGLLRGSQACQVLLSSPWTAHKPGRCCDSVTSVILLSLSSSTNAPPPPTESPLLSSVGSQLIFGTSLAIPETFCWQSITPLSPRR